MNARHKALKRQLDESEEENSRLNHQIRKLKRDLDDVTEQVRLVAKSAKMIIPFSNFLVAIRQPFFTPEKRPLYTF